MENIMKLEFVGIDGWYRCVFKDIDTGVLYKDCDCLHTDNFTIQEIAEKFGDLHTAANNSFNGEPNMPLDLSINRELVII